MRFNPKAKLDTGRISDSGRGGGGGGGGMSLPIPGGAKAGGGLGMVLVLLVFFVLTQCAGVDITGGGAAGLPQGGGQLDASRIQGADSARYDACESGADAENSTDCARVAVENSLYDYWATEVPRQTDGRVQFQPATMQTFSAVVSTACGQATSQVGPFYCPADSTIYLDTTFFEDVLQRQLGGPAGEFVEPYVLAHEYGHHIQNLTGQIGQVRTQQGPRSDAVRLELQADCYAGMWTRQATSTDDAGGEPLILELTEQDVREAMAAAQSVGDDRIQKQTQGRVSPEGWTHGSAEQRMRWFRVGYDRASMAACDTFRAKEL